MRQRGPRCGVELRSTLVKINLKIIGIVELLAVVSFNVGMVGFCSGFATASATLKDDHFSDDVFQVNFDQGGSTFLIRVLGCPGTSLWG